MSGEVYNGFATALGIGGLVGLGLAAAYLIAAIVGWRGPYRKHRLVRFGLWLATFPVCAAITYSLLFFMFLPTLAREDERMQAEQTFEQIKVSSIVHVGDQGPSFTLKNADGGEFSLDDCRGKVVLVNFFATWCGPCLKELPHVQKIWDEHHENSRFALIVIGREETTETINEFRLKHGYTFPMAPDPERFAYSLYAEESIPRTYLVGVDGQICFASTGFHEDELTTLKAEVAKQLRSIQ